MDKLFVPLGVAALVLLVAGFAVGTIWQPSTELSQETGKLFLQWVFVVALGAPVALVVDILKKQAESRSEAARKKREAEDRERAFATETLRSAIDRMDAAYQQVKLLRRHLRAKTGSDLGIGVDKQDYWTAMLALNEQHSELEQLIKDGKALSFRVPELARVDSHLAAMEGYLTKIWKETEKNYASMTESSDLRELVRLRGLLAKSSGTGDFTKGFVPIYREARKSLIESLAARHAGRPEDEELAQK